MTDAAAGESPVPALLRRARLGYRPPAEEKVSEFADRHIVVTSGPLAGTRWRTDFAPYQRGILDAIHEKGVEIVVVMGSSQWGKTACAVNVVGYHIARDPCLMLVVEPTVDPMAKDFARNRLEPVIAATAVLSDVVAKKRAKDASNTTLQKTFRGGSLSVGGANSAASLASRAVRLLILDEIDRYPRELQGEGSTIEVALKRTSSYGRRRRVLMLSSPTVVGAPIHSWFLNGDQRKFFVPCPGCGVYHTFEWANVKWDEADPRSARLECPACGRAISEAERRAVLRHGEWRATSTDRVDRSIISFHLWEAYSPLSSIQAIVTAFLRARKAQKAGDRSEMHTWQNTTLGEPHEPDQGDGVDGSTLIMRREGYPVDADVPAGACVLTMGVDVQDDRLEVLVIGWGPGEESWLVERATLPGDTEQPEPWKALDEILSHDFKHETGIRLPIAASCLDTAGHRTTIAYGYALRQAARRMYAIIGRDGPRPIVSSPSPRRWGRSQRQVPLYTVGVDAAKSLFLSRLALTREPDHVGRFPGYVHLPHADWCDEELIAQLTSERLRTTWTKGVPKSAWVKIRARNEMLDCAVYAHAALRLLNPRLEDLAARLVMPVGPPAPTKPTGGGWLGPRRGGSWLRGRR